MKVLMASPEAVPFAKTGGLADISGALPDALKRMGIDVSLVLPKHRVIDDGRFGLKETGISLKVEISGRKVSGDVLTASSKEGVPVYFIRNDLYFDRVGLYGEKGGDYRDNAERFVFFSKAVLELCKALRIKNDIIHCNDWQTALIPLYLREKYRDEKIFAKTATVFTIHNLAYQGLFWHFDYHLTGLDWDLFTPSGIEFYGKVNFMKGGLLFADHITTVSPRYSEEIQGVEQGCGLEGVIAGRKDDLSGILNGVDYSEWNPETDPDIAERYGPGNLKGKQSCKRALQKIFSLPERGDVPLIGMISRLVDQKGLDLIEAGMDRLMEMDIQMVFLGTGDPRYEEMLEGMSRMHPEKAAVSLRYDSALAHRIEAGADIFLMPSRFEPCGLNQIYSLKYGTIPIVRDTGGLDDTITLFDPETGKGNGFKFSDYSSDAMLAEIGRAISLYRNSSLWGQVMENAMSSDFSMETMALGYLDVYGKAIEKVKKQRRGADQA